MACLDFHPVSPISTPFYTFLLISTMDSHTLVWPLELEEWELNDEEVAALDLGGALSAVRAQCNYLGVWP